MYNIYTLYGIIHIVEGKMENIEERNVNVVAIKNIAMILVIAAMMNQWYLKWKMLMVKK